MRKKGRRRNIFRRIRTAGWMEITRQPAGKPLSRDISVGRRMKKRIDYAESFNLSAGVTFAGRLIGGKRQAASRPMRVRDINRAMHALRSPGGVKKASISRPAW